LDIAVGEVWLAMLVEGDGSNCDGGG